MMCTRTLTGELKSLRSTNSLDSDKGISHGSTEIQSSATLDILDFMRSDEQIII